jgi:hypothetical protein
VPLFTVEQRQETVDRVAALLEQDERIEACALVGSLAAEPDRWSDIDLAAVVAEPGSVAGDWVERLSRELPVVHHFETAFGTTLVRGFLLDNLLELDLAFTPAAEFHVWGPARVLFDRTGLVSALAAEPTPWAPPAPDWAGEAGLAWHDVLHARVAVERGRLWQGLFYLQRVRNRTFGLAQERHGHYADFFDYVDDLPAEELKPFPKTLPGSLKPRELLRALEAVTQELIAELHRGDPELAARVEGPLLELVQPLD